MRGYAERKQATFYAEPEEDCWPDAVLKRDQCGHFGAMTWFRSQRVPGYVAARQDADDGQLAVIDSFYDGLMHRLIGQPGMEWLITADDPYYEISKEMARLDWQQLPAPDVLICFQIDYQRWDELLSGRGRQLDAEPELRNSYATQELFIQASRDYAAEKNIPFILFEQNFHSITEAIDHLEHELAAYEPAR